MNCRTVHFVVVIPPGMTAPLLDQNNRIFNELTRSALVFH